MSSIRSFLKFWMAILLSLIYLTNCTKSDKITLLKDISYGNYLTGQTNRELLLDLYLPESSKKALPVLIYIHGGGWLSLSKENCPGEIVAKRGYALACINYRYSSEALFPAQIQDVKQAVRWLRGNASRYHLDPNKFGAWGDSAGGHLSALLGTSAGVSILEGKSENSHVSTQIQAVADWYGPTDFTQVPPAFEESPTPGVLKKNKGKPWLGYTEATYKLLGNFPIRKPALATLANPITHIDADDPPFLIVHGELDEVVPIAQSKILFEALKRKGVEVEFVKLPDLTHTHAGKNGERFDPQLIDLTLEFFDKHLSR